MITLQVDVEYMATDVLIEGRESYHVMFRIRCLPHPHTLYATRVYDWAFLPVRMENGDVILRKGSFSM